jgi:hypothetical protein
MGNREEQTDHTGQNNQDQNQSSQDVSQSSAAPGSRTGEPGRTPGKAEGDRDTVDQSLEDKEQKGQI